MEGEIITVSNSSHSSKPVDTISILVVDDDTTCLTIIAAILKKCKYEVVTVKNPIDALCTLRIKGGSFDLVVTDVHMPDMNGFELQQVITEEFKLPVVLMSADDKEGVMLKGLETGAAYFIAKPISLEDVRDLWQYAALKKKTKTFIDETETKAFIDETENNHGKSMAAKSTEENIASATSINEETETKRDSKRRSLSEDCNDKDEENGDSITTKKAKIVWTNALHNRFLEAIRSIGLDRAVPKKILELMKVPGLTRENVASHLQKYRIFLRRVSDASYTIQPTNGRSLTSRAFRPNYATGNPSLMPNKFSQVSQQNPEHQAQMSALQRKTGKHVAVLNNSKLNAASFSCQEASSSNSIMQSGVRQSPLLCDRTNTWKPTIGSTIPLYQRTGIGFRMESNNLQAGLLSHRQISSSLTNTRSGIGMFLPLTQAASDGVSNSLSIYRATTLGASGTSYIPAHRKTVTSSTTNRIENPNLNTCYVGYQLADIEQLTHKEYQIANASTCLEGIDGLIDEIQNGNVTATTMSNNHNTDQLAQFVSPGGFGGDNQYSSTLAGGIPEAGVQLLPPTPSLHNSFGNGQGTDPILSAEFDMSTVHNISTQQSRGLGDLSSTLLNQFDTEFPVQHIGGEGKMSSDFCSVGGQMDNTLPWFDETSGQHGEACLVDPENFGASQSQLNTTLLSANERDDDEFLESLLASGPFEGDENLAEI